MKFILLPILILFLLNRSLAHDLPKRLKCESVGESYPKIEFDIQDMTCFYIHCLQMDPTTLGSMLAIWKKGESRIYELRLFYPHHRKLESKTLLENDSTRVLEGVCKDCIQETSISLSNQDSHFENWKGSLRFKRVKWLNRSSSVAEVKCKKIENHPK